MYLLSHFLRHSEKEKREDLDRMKGINFNLIKNLRNLHLLNKATKSVRSIIFRHFYPWMVFWAFVTGLFVYLGSVKGLSCGYWDWALVLITVIISSTIIKIRPWLIKKHKYFEEKFSAPYIILFMALLVLCAFLLILKLDPIAEQVANIGFFYW